MDPLIEGGRSSPEDSVFMSELICGWIRNTVVLCRGGENF